MAGVTRRRAVGLLVAVAVLTVALGGVAATPIAALYRAGWLASKLSTLPQPAPHRAAYMPQPTSVATNATKAIKVSPTDPGAILLQLAARDVSPDAQLRVMASGFRSGELLVVAIEDMQGQIYAHATLQAGGDGRLRETSLALPARLAAGNYRVIVVGNTSQRTASATFQMHDTPPTVTLDAYTAVPGHVVSFAGNGFIPGEVVKVYLGPASAPRLSAVATAGGAVNGRLEIPKLPAGAYTLTLLGENSQTPTSVGFQVQRFTPWVVLDRYALAPGEGVGFIAHGFAPGEQVFVYLNALGRTTGTGTPVLRVTADSSGQVDIQDTWSPALESGTNVLRFVGQWSKATTTAAFIVLATGQQTSQQSVQPPASPTTP